LGEQNYEIYNKELLAIVEAITKWRQYLLDATEKFEVWTDHENLKYFWEPHKLNGRQAKWYLKLQDYNFILWHILRKTNTKANVVMIQYKVVYLIYYYPWSVLATVHPTLNNHEYNMRPACVVHTV